MDHILFKKLWELVEVWYAIGSLVQHFVFLLIPEITLGAADNGPDPFYSFLIVADFYNAMMD